MAIFSKDCLLSKLIKARKSVMEMKKENGERDESNSVRKKSRGKKLKLREETNV